MMHEKDRAAAYALRGDALLEGTPQDFLPFLREPGHVVSLVGGGGKTTLMYHLASCFAAQGFRTAVMTTTRIGRPKDACGTIEDCRARWAAGEIAVCGEIVGEGKFRAPGEETLRSLLEQAQAVVIEADGARRLPCKAPAEHEPVLLPQSDIVVGVMGLDALGRRISDVCLRREHVCALLGCGEEHALTPADMAKILLSGAGTRKNVAQRDYYIVLNKCDGEGRLEGGREILSLLREKGNTQAIMTCGMRRSETYEFHDK